MVFPQMFLQPLEVSGLRLLHGGAFFGVSWGWHFLHLVVLAAELRGELGVRSGVRPLQDCY